MDEVTKKKISYKLRGQKKQARTKLLISRALTGKQAISILVSKSSVD